jgi:TRAP-type mannitol/chloroaromatic compound transport system permease small subunit
MPALDMFIRQIDALSTRVGRLISWLTLVMVLVGAFNALARYLGKFTELQLSSNAYLELQWYLFSMVFLLGASHTLQRDQHVRVDVLYGSFSKRSKAWLDLLGGTFFLIPFCIFGLIVCWPMVSNSWTMGDTWLGEGSPDPGGLPRAPIKTMMLVCFGLLLLQALAEIGKQVRTLLEPKETV